MALAQFFFVSFLFLHVTQGSPIFNVIGPHYGGSSEASLEEKLLPKLSYLKYNEDLRDSTLQIFQKFLRKYDHDKTNIVCTACKSAVDSIFYKLELGSSLEEIFDLALKLCDYFNIFHLDVCMQYLDVAGPSLFYVLNTTDWGPEAICSFFLSDVCYVEIPELSWEIDLPPQPKTDNIQRDDQFVNSTVLRVLHLTDTHFDPEYVEGSWDECNMPECCRDPLPDENATKAGRWGGWKCDIPERTLDSILDFAFSTADIDYVIWTGDIPAHDIWNQTEDRNSLQIMKTIKKLNAYKSGLYTVLPALGNHEPVPGNLLTTPSQQNLTSYEWLYDILATNWTTGTGWLPTSVQDSIRYGGFYSVTIRPKLRLVSLNTVFCYTLNWWLILDFKDAGGQLVWLVDILLDAESSGDKVQIIGHVPPSGKECSPEWRKNYYRIVERFKDTIVGQFFGHTHDDEFALVLSNQNYQEAVGVMYLAPSATTYSYRNPSFRIYSIEGDYEGSNWSVLDYDAWIMDLERSNELEEPVFRKLYSVKEAFGMDSLNPQDFLHVYEKLKSDADFLDQYDRFFWSDSPKRKNCDEKCVNSYLCKIVNCQLYGTDLAK